MQQFDDKILNVNPTKQINEKRKKDAFKKLVEDVIGVSKLCKQSKLIKYHDQYFSYCQSCIPGGELLTNVIITNVINK